MTTFTAQGNWSLADWDLSSLAGATPQMQAADKFSLLAGDGTLSAFRGTDFADYTGGLPRQGTVTHLTVTGAADSFSLGDFALSANDFRTFVTHNAMDRLERAIFAGSDQFDLSAGNQTHVAGFGGNDTFNFGGTFDAGDTVDGGDGYDTLRLDGDYSGGLVLGAATMGGIEMLSVARGHNYNLTLDNANIDPSAILTVDAYSLSPDDSLTFDGSAERHGSININAGRGTDVLLTGSGADILDGNGGRDTMHSGKGADLIYGGAGRDTIQGGKDDDTIYGDEGNDRLTPGTGHDSLYGGAGDDDFYMRGRTGMADVMDGGDGEDTVHVRGSDFSDFTLTAPQLAGVENVKLGAGHTYRVNFDDTALGNHVKVDGSALGATDTLEADASQATGSAVTLVGGAAGDTLVGSALGDIIQGGLGADTLTGGGGADTFAFASGADSSGNAIDTITDFDGATDVIDVANAVTGISGSIGGLLSNLDGLTSMLGVANLAAGHAVLIQPILGALAGETLMIVDQNGVLGYQPGSDILINLENPADLGSLGLDSFI